MRSGDDFGEVGFSGQSTTSTGFFDAALFYRLCDKITSNIFQIVKHASTLEKTLKTIGTKSDIDALRDSVHVVTTTALQTIYETTTNLKLITSMVQRSELLENVSGKEEKIRVTRLTSDFQSSLQKFADTLSKMTVSAFGRAMMDSEDQNQSLVDSEAARQAQAQQHQQVEFEQGLIIESRIRQIETGILDSNDIMKDLANLVHEQGMVGASIEGNIDSTYTQVEARRNELQKAETYQSKYWKRLFCLLGTGLIMIILIVVIFIFIFVT